MLRFARSPGSQTLAINAMVLALGIVNSVILSREFAPEGRGGLAAALLWPGLITLLVGNGFIEASVYFSAMRPTRSRELLGVGWLFTFALSAIAMPAGFLALPFLLSSQTASTADLSKVYLLVIPFHCAAEFYTAILQGRHSYS